MDLWGIFSWYVSRSPNSRRKSVNWHNCFLINSNWISFQELSDSGYKKHVVSENNAGTYQSCDLGEMTTVLFSQQYWNCQSKQYMKAVYVDLLLHIHKSRNFSCLSIFVRIVISRHQTVLFPQQYLSSIWRLSTA